MNQLPLLPLHFGFFGSGPWSDAELKLQARFRELQARYFPRWRNAVKWRVRANRFLREVGLAGFCRRRYCRIEFDPCARDLNSKAENDVFLIHECCHAVAQDSAAQGCHHRAWYDRMMRIAGELERDGEIGTARLLREDAEQHWGREETLALDYGVEFRRAPDPPFVY